MRSITMIAGLLVLCGYCTAETLYVDINGPNDPGTGSYEDPYLKIQDALDSADSNGVIIVASGRYYENISIETENIVLKSTDPDNPNDRAATVIDGNGIGSTVTFSGAGSSGAALKGFTITNGLSVYGGGVYCNSSGSPTITNCIITGNSANYGGGINCFNSSNPIITKCIITGNSADYGGGIACIAAQAAIDNCAIIDNTAAYGAGMVCLDSNTNITNCTMSQNTASSNGNGLACNSAQQSYPSDVEIISSILWNGEGEIWNNDASTIKISYSDVSGGWPGIDNMDIDPMLQADGYHLSEVSPCRAITKDHNGQTDIDDQVRLTGTYTDIGCDEFWLTGDLNYDEYVNWKDIAILALEWSHTGDSQGGDLNSDKNIDFSDLKGLLENWLLCSQFGNFNHDEIVDFSDFGLLARYWMSYPCSEPNWCDGSDLDRSGSVDFIDLERFLTNWLR